MSVKPFGNLTHRGQLGRLKGLALKALEAYPITPTNVTPLVHLFNSTFQVETKNGRFVLRINRPNDRSQAEIRSEMQWLASLRRETPLIVPDPLANLSGDLVTHIQVPGVLEPRDCVVFHWVEGSFYRKRLGPTALERVGSFMAHLHNHVQQFDFPAGFVRPNLELDGEVGRLLQHGLKHGRELLTDEMCQDMTRTVDVIRPKIDSLGKNNSVYNLIHADLHQGNYLFKKKTVRAIDFDDCGWGHLVYDMAITFWYLGQHPALPAMRTAFLKGYRSARPFSAEHESLIDTFMALRSLLMISFMASERNPRIRQFAPQFIASIHQRLQRYLQTAD
ncbi:MAG: phosphotransferase [Candidatus Promineifilaceae bacterium]